MNTVTITIGPNRNSTRRHKYPLEICAVTADNKNRTVDIRLQELPGDEGCVRRAMRRWGEIVQKLQVQR